MPTVLVIGGPNGAGKTTTAMDLLPKELHWRHFVNADNIAAGLSPLDPESVAISAGKIMLKRIHELAAQGEDFAFETTLAAKTFARFLRGYQERGYTVRLLYVWLDDPSVAVTRVAYRVRKGGHHIPEDVIRRRYRSGLMNLFRIYIPLADAWAVCDNTGEERFVVARGGRTLPLQILDVNRWSVMQEAAR